MVRRQSTREEMEENGSSAGGERGGDSGFQWWWVWASASIVQLGWGVSSVRRGLAGDSRFMPLKAFAVASLFVGSAASASVATLKASGIHKVQDFIEVGANIRTGLGVRPRVPQKKADDL